jgi:hypothetical protein
LRYRDRLAVGEPFFHALCDISAGWDLSYDYPIFGIQLLCKLLEPRCHLLQEFVLFVSGKVVADKFDFTFSSFAAEGCELTANGFVQQTDTKGTAELAGGVELVDGVRPEVDAQGAVRAKADNDGISR